MLFYFLLSDLKTELLKSLFIQMFYHFLLSVLMFIVLASFSKKYSISSTLFVFGIKNNVKRIFYKNNSLIFIFKGFIFFIYLFLLVLIQSIKNEFNINLILSDFFIFNLFVTYFIICFRSIIKFIKNYHFFFLVFFET